MFILAHQFRAVSSENNRSDTCPADFAQASRVQSVKHLVSNATTPRRRLSYSWRHIGLEASALPRYRTRENEYRVRRVKESKASRCFEPAAHVSQRLPTRRMCGRPISPAPRTLLIAL